MKKSIVPTKTKPEKKPKKNYHHGNLKEVLIQAALELTAQKGPLGFSIREVARLAGVSPAAPYRHFADTTGLMTAVAEKGVQLLQTAIVEQVEKAGRDPLEIFRAQGIAVVKFAVENPGHFRVMNTPEYSQAANSAILMKFQEENKMNTKKILSEARKSGQLSSASDEMIQLTANALIYGLAYMFVDGHFDADVNLPVAEKIAMAVTDVLGQGLIPRT